MSGISPAARSWLEACVARHIEEETGIIEEYRGLAKASESGPIGLLIGLILADEERHHPCCARWAMS